MGDAAGEDAEALELLRLEQLALEHLALLLRAQPVGDVVHAGHGPGVVALVVELRRGRHQRAHAAPVLPEELELVVALRMPASFWVSRDCAKSFHAPSQNSSRWRPTISPTS